MRNSLGVAVSAALLLAAVQAQALDILSQSEIAEREKRLKLQARPVQIHEPWDSFFIVSRKGAKFAKGKKFEQTRGANHGDKDSQTGTIRNCRAGR